MVKKKKKNLTRRFLTENIGVVPRNIGTIGDRFILKPSHVIDRLAYEHQFSVVAFQTADHLVPFWDLGHF